MYCTSIQIIGGIQPNYWGDILPASPLCFGTPGAIVSCSAYCDVLCLLGCHNKPTSFSLQRHTKPTMTQDCYCAILCLRCHKPTTVYCCCSAYLSYYQRTASDANLLDVPHTFHCSDYFVIGGIRTCLGVSDNPMFL